MNKITNYEVRKWIYNVSIALFAFLAVLGVVSGEWYASFGILASAITGMARVNTTDAGAEK